MCYSQICHIFNGVTFFIHWKSINVCCNLHCAFSPVNTSNYNLLTCLLTKYRIWIGQRPLETFLVKLLVQLTFVWVKVQIKFDAPFLHKFC